MLRTLLAPNGTRVYTQADVEDRTQSMTMARGQIMAAQELISRLNPNRETGGDNDYVMPISSGSTGLATPNLGFGFGGDSFRRTRHGSMEFTLPVGQVDTMNLALEYAEHNVFISKALRVKTDFTCKGLTNKTSKPQTNKFFDSVIKRLGLADLYRQAVWMYYTPGLVVILLPEPGEPFTFASLIDPRQCRVFQMFGQKAVFVVPDQKMINACKDPNGAMNFINKINYDMIPVAWRTQIIAGLQIRPRYNPASVGASGEMLIKLTPYSYVVIENRDTIFNKDPQGYDGCPLTKYFSEAEQYRMLLAGDFATAFVSKNLIALVSIGDPQTEGENYQRPDTPTLQGVAQTFETSNGSQWVFGEKTLDVRYVTPDPETWAHDKWRAPLEGIKNILPSPFWFNDGSGSFAGASMEIKTLREEVDTCNDRFDRLFWTALYERAAADPSAPRIADKDLRPPEHDKSSLIEDSIRLQSMQNAYADGGISMRTLLAEYGYDYDVERQRKLDEKKDIDSHIWIPAFEAKQGIVSGIEYKVGNAGKENFPIGTPPSPPDGGDGGPGGRPVVPGSRPQPETSGPRAPRPGNKK